MSCGGYPCLGVRWQCQGLSRLWPLQAVSVLNVVCCGASSVTVGTVAVSGASGTSCGVSNVIGFGMIAKAVTFTAFFL